MKKRNTFLAAMLSAAMAFSATPATVAQATPAEPASTTAYSATGADTSNTNGETKEDPDGPDPTKDTWDKNGASSDPAPDGPFKREALNRLSAYLNSNHFKTVSAIVEVIAGVITVSSQLAAIVITVSPTAKAQFEAFMKQFS